MYHYLRHLTYNIDKRQQQWGFRITHPWVTGKRSVSVYSELDGHNVHHNGVHNLLAYTLKNYRIT